MLSKNRVIHSLGVANRMKMIATEMYPDRPEFAQDMFILGIMHDVGYEFASSQSEHAKIGGEKLKKNGYKYWKEVFYHGKSGVEYESDSLQILNIADLLTDPNGNDITVFKRLEDIKVRYGENSSQFVDAEKLAKELNLL